MADNTRNLYRITQACRKPLMTRIPDTEGHHQNRNHGHQDNGLFSTRPAETHEQHPRQWRNQPGKEWEDRSNHQEGEKQRQPVVAQHQFR